MAIAVRVRHLEVRFIRVGHPISVGILHVVGNAVWARGIGVFRFAAGRRHVVQADVDHRASAFVAFLGLVNSRGVVIKSGIGGCAAAAIEKQPAGR